MKMAEDEQFAQAVKRRREHLGISQAELGRRCEGVEGGSFSQQTIAQIEKGDRRVSIGEAVAISDALDDSIESLIYGEVSATGGMRTLARALDRIVGLASNDDVRRAIWHSLGTSISLENIDHEAWVPDGND